MVMAQRNTSSFVYRKVFDCGLIIQNSSVYFLSVCKLPNCRLFTDELLRVHYSITSMPSNPKKMWKYLIAGLKVVESFIGTRRRKLLANWQGKGGRQRRRGSKSIIYTKESKQPWKKKLQMIPSVQCTLSSWCWVFSDFEGWKISCFSRPHLPRRTYLRLKLKLLSWKAKYKESLRALFWLRDLPVSWNYII